TFTICIQADRYLWAWGSNGSTSGQLGIGSSANEEKTSPVEVSVEAGSKWRFVSAGQNFSMAVNEDGTLWAWGNNNNGRLGNNKTTHETSPVRISSDK
ncbi:MAG: RCC1 domain-containing protein, partial [Treponema sp.]|nr:RCC1 domain-containing protein [Treponema sp.]